MIRKTNAIKKETDLMVKSNITLTGHNLRKAALFMISIGSKASAKIFKHLTSEEIEELSTEIARINNVTSEDLNEVDKEFFEMVQAQEYITKGGVLYAQEILEEALGTSRALEITRRVQASLQVRGFNVLENVDQNQLLIFLQKEHPQTIALVLSQMPALQASNILVELPNDAQVNVIHRLAKMDRVSPETIQTVERVLEKNIDFSAGTSQFGGVKAAAEMLNMVGARYEKNILAGIARENADLAVEIKNLMFVFEDIVHLDDRSIQKVLKEVENRELAMALKLCSEELKDKILSNMSKRAAEMIREELDYMGPVRLKEVEEIQQRIIDIIRRLEEEDEIVISGGSGEDQLI